MTARGVYLYQPRLLELLVCCNATTQECFAMELLTTLREVATVQRARGCPTGAASLSAAAAAADFAAAGVVAAVLALAVAAALALAVAVVGIGLPSGLVLALASSCSRAGVTASGCMAHSIPKHSATCVAKNRERMRNISVNACTKAYEDTER